MTEAAIHITASPRATIRVDLVGVLYNIAPPKTALALKLGQQAVQAGKSITDSMKLFGTIEDWTNQAFGLEADAVRARLEDSDDELDVSHLFELMQAIIERTSGNPTSSS